MPRYKDPFEKGELIVQFSVKFPEDIDPRFIPQLEMILSPKPQIDFSTNGEHVEEVMLMELGTEHETSNERRNRGRK